MNFDSKLESQDLLCFLQDLPAATIARLYQFSAPCLAVFRELPDLAKQYIMRMLFLEQPLPKAILNSWPRGTARSQTLHQEAMAKLENLRVCEVIPIAGGQQGVQLFSAFKKNIHVLICGGGSPWAVVGHSGEDKHARDVDYLNSYANKQWEAILRFLVGDINDDVSLDTVELLKHAGLLNSSSDRSPPKISQKGFQFLLMDRSTQVWYFLMQYLSTVEERGFDLIEVLNFIFQLSFLTLGKRSSKRYFPTKLAVNLVSGRGQQVEKSGFLVLETNFRLMAYTDSPLQIAILDLFTQLQYRFPNFVVGTITRESVHKALKNGISANQVLSFLQQHAHPQMLSNSPIIPSTVSDQIRLWELERDRLEISEGVLYSEFMSIGDFEIVRKYAEDLGVLLWSNPGKRFIVVAASGHDEVRRFWRRQTKKT